MRTRVAACLLALLAGLSGCSMERRVDTVSPRTVLVYMVASNLDYAMTRNIEEMIEAASEGGLNGGNLIVFYSGSQSEAELFEIRRGTGGAAVRRHIRDYTDMSAVSHETMRQVIREVVDMYPARSYGMILSSHATSWLPADYGNAPRQRSFGEENGRRMEIYELAAALPDGLFEFLIFDACSMASIECVYELRNKADYIMASPSEILSYGIPYKTVLPCLFTATADLEGAARNFYFFYRDYQYPYGNISVVRTEALEELAQITREIATASRMGAGYSEPLPNWQLLSFWKSSPTKLFDFGHVICSQTTSYVQRSRFKASIERAVMTCYSTEEIYCSDNAAPVPVFHFSGLSFYPLQTQLSELNEWYRRLEWYRAVY
ncbi:MAG: hypothetical protein LBK07_00430 [Tannerella sp.]|nr:hypothetical protein [Tannerella sp.]